MNKVTGRLAVVLSLIWAPAAGTVAVPTPCPAVPTNEIAFRAGHFDAWIADSDIRAGVSEVQWTAGGCALLESWVGAVTGQGTALYYHEQGRWHLRFVNSDGRTLALSGLAQGGGVSFEGRHPDLSGRTGVHRMLFAPEGTNVRQTWHFRSDASGKWELLLDAVQRRRPPAG